MVPVGKNRGRVVEAELRKSTKEGGGKAPYVFIRFAVGTESVDFFGSFSTTVIQQGKESGKQVGELTAVTLVGLGWEGDFNKFSELIGVETEIVVEHTADDQGRSSAKVRFINTPTSSGTPADSGDVAALAKNFRAVVVEAKKKRPVAIQRPAQASSGGGKPPVDTTYDEYDDRGPEPF